MVAGNMALVNLLIGHILITGRRRNYLFSKDLITVGYRIPNDNAYLCQAK